MEGTGYWISRTKNQLGRGIRTFLVRHQFEIDNTESILSRFEPGTPLSMHPANEVQHYMVGEVTETQVVSCSETSTTMLVTLNVMHSDGSGEFDHWCIYPPVVALMEPWTASEGGTGYTVPPADWSLSLGLESSPPGMKLQTSPEPQKREQSAARAPRIRAYAEDGWIEVIDEHRFLFRRDGEE